MKDRPGHDRRYAIDARKIERELGWRPAETFETGIARPCAGISTTRTGWRTCRRRLPGMGREELRYAPMRLLLIGKNSQLGFPSCGGRWPRSGEVFGVDFPECDLAQPASIQAIVAQVNPHVIVNAAAYGGGQNRIGAGAGARRHQRRGTRPAGRGGA